MQTFRAGAPTSVTLPFADANGQPVTPIALSYRVVDEAGADVVPSSQIESFDAASGEVALQISASENAIDAGVFAGYRRVILTISTAAGGPHTQEAEYLLSVSTALVLMVNSFQSYEQALVLALQLGQLDGWSGADPQARKSALARAYDNICSFSYTMIQPTQQSDEEGSIVNEVSFGSFRDVTAEEFGTLTTNQQLDFRKAQIVEADFLLGGHPIEKKIRDGEQSSTIGETSTFFRPRASLVLPISRSTVSYIGKYIVWSRPLGRV
jgi:hypothetical protein